MHRFPLPLLLGGLVITMAAGCPAADDDDPTDDTDVVDTDDTDTVDDTDEDDDTDGGDTDETGDTSGAEVDCTADLGTTSFGVPYDGVVVGTTTTSVATADWEYVTLERPDHDGLWTVDLRGEGALEIEAYQGMAGEVPYFEAVELGTLPDGSSAAYFGALEGAPTWGWFPEDPVTYEPQGTTIFRVRSADPDTCVPWTLDVASDATYTCVKSSDPSTQFSVDAPAMVLGDNEGNVDIDQAEDEDFWADTVPAGASRTYTLWSIQPAELFGLSTDEGMISGSFESDPVTPVSFTWDNTAGTEPYELFVRVDADFALWAERSALSTDCVPYTIEVVEAP